VKTIIGAALAVITGCSVAVVGGHLTAKDATRQALPTPYWCYYHKPDYIQQRVIDRGLRLCVPGPVPNR
jgi:hypothetical protein